MKTFDEAFKELYTECKSIDLVCFGDEQFANELFCNFIEETCARWRVKLLTSEPEDMEAKTCGMLQAMFNAGMIVGMRMERPIAKGVE